MLGRRQLLIPALALTLAVAGPMPPRPKGPLFPGALLGFSTEGAERGARPRGPLRRLAQRRQPARLDAADHLASPSRRLALGQVERRVHGGPVPLLGIPDRDRAVQGPLPDAQDAPAGDGGAHPLQGEPRRAAGRRRLHLAARPPSSSRSTTPTRSTATSPASWSTSTTACPRTTRSCSGGGSTSRARS